MRNTRAGGGRPSEATPSAQGEWRDDLDTIKEQSRETLALLRQLIELLLPRGDPNKPRLEDLIAALVTQQRRTLELLKHVDSDVSALCNHLLPNGGIGNNGERARTDAGRA